MWLCVRFYLFLLLFLKLVTRGVCVSKRMRILTTAHCLGTVSLSNRMQSVLRKCGVYADSSEILSIQIQSYYAMRLCCLFHKERL